MEPCVRWGADAPTGRDTFTGVYGPLQSIGFYGLGKSVSCMRKNGWTDFNDLYVVCRVLRKEVLFGDSDKAAPYLRGIIPQNLHFRR